MGKIDLELLEIKNTTLSDMPARIVKYKGNGYEIEIKHILDTLSVKFTGIRAVTQPEIKFYPGKGCYLEMNGICMLEDVDIFIQNVQDAKDLAEYVTENLDNLISGKKEQ